MFAFSGEIKLKNWSQALDIVMLWFWCPICIWLSEKQMHKKCRNVRDWENSVQYWIHVVASFLILSSRNLHFFSAYVLRVPCLYWYHLTVYWTINVNFACLLKLYPGNRKCWSACSEFRLFTSFRWLLSLKLKAVLDLSVYSFLHDTHSIRYIRYYTFIKFIRL